MAPVSRLAQPPRGQGYATDGLNENGENRDMDRALADDHQPERIANDGANNGQPQQ